MLDRMRRGEWTAALELSRPILKAQDVPSQFITTISLWRAECYENLGDDENQAISLRRAIAADPDFLPAHSRLAQLLFRTGKIKEAQTEYAWLMAQSPAYAREFVTELLLAQSPEARFPLSSAEVDRLFERWRESAPNDPLPLLCRLDYFQRRGDDDKVAPLIDAGIQNWPKEVGFRIARADVLLRARNWDEAWAFLEDAERNCGLHASLLVRKIACIEGVDPAEQPAKLITCAQQFANLDRDDQAFVLPILMRGLQRAGVDPNVVKQILAEYGDQNSGDVLARLTLFQLAVGGGDMESARRHLETLQETLGGESPAFKLAALLCDVKAATLGDAEARSRARTALGLMQDAYPDLAPQWFTLKADLDLSEQRPLKALESLQSALQSGDRRVATLTRAVSLMVLNGRLEQTVPYLKSFVESNAASLEKEGSSADDAPSDQRTDGEARAATSILPRRFDMSDLRAALEPAAASWPVALVVFRIDLELEQPDRAAEMIQKALAAAPGNPLVWANWLAYVEQHRPDRLKEELREAESKLSVADRARALSSVLLRTNRFEDAERLLKAATQSDPRDPDLFRARVRLMRQKPGGENVEALLRETLAGRDESLASVREVARRELARLLATQKDYRRFREALDLSAEIAADADPADVEAWLIRAEVCQAHLGHWSDAVAAYRKIQNFAEEPVRVEALSQEAKIHEQRRHWDDEAKALSELRALSPDGAQVVIRLLLNAVRRHDRAAAQALRQEVASASDDRTIGLMCDVFLATLSDDRSDVVSKVSAALEAKEIGLDTAFDWLALLKATDKCEAVLQQQIDPKKPETVAKYALFLAAHERLPDALVQLSQLWKSGARDAAIYVATGMTSMKEVAPDDLKPLRSTVLKLAAPDDAPTRMLIAAATLEDHAGRHAEAISFYRRALLREPENVMALNNAAFLEAVSDFASDDGRLELVRRAIELVGPIDQLLDTEGVVLLRTGDALSALEKFQQAYEQRAEPNYLIHLAWALAELEQWDAAAEAYRKADASEPAPRLHPLEKLLDAAWRQRVHEHEKSADAAPQ
jgi:tetratricopeptide (TPR) repeat protein